jgi:hypothetical protein
MTVSLVQTGHNTGITNSITVTLTNNIAKSDGIIVVAANTDGISSVTGGDSFSLAVNDAVTTTYIYYVLSSAGGYKTITVTSPGTNGTTAYVYEVTQLASLDKTNNGFSGSAISPWSSGPTGVTANPNEFVVGTYSGVTTGSAPVITPPSSPWSNEAALSVGTYLGSITGYQLATATGNFTYSGTATGSGPDFYGACIATFVASPSSAALILAMSPL